MPIKVSCQCGTNLNVPDAAAGKNVKCPKCQKVLAVPAGQPKSDAGSKTAQNSKSAAGTKPPANSGGAGSAKPVAATKAPDALANLFESAGLKKREGTFCPSCDRSLPPGTAICVGCGFNLETGAKLDGFELETKEFGDKRLVEAAEMMKREAETEKRLLSPGLPRWMEFAMILVVLFMMTAILLKIDAQTSGQSSSIAPIAILLRFSSLAVFSSSLGR